MTAEHNVPAGAQYNRQTDEGGPMFDLRKLLVDVFDPQQGEVVTVAVDEPRDGVPDTDAWVARRRMASRWRDELVALGEERGFSVNPLLSWPATGANNADLPASARLGDERVDLERTLSESTLVVAMTQYSATAPLAHLADAHPDFRAASMPGVEERMERTALAADYAVVASRCRAIFDAMEGAELLDVTFSTGHRCWFDLRHRRPEMDDGSLPRDKQGDRIINLPSGETFIVPYEGEIDGVPSHTAGTIPMRDGDELILLHIVGNTIQVVEGDGAGADRWAEFFAADPARANIAEVAFGVNDTAEITGVVLEDEKAGFHWAYGRSDHLGGVTGVSAFTSPEMVVHTDIVYAADSPIQVLDAIVVHPDGRRVPVIADGEYRL
jgi:leucyl aminopeptidase (aminopeptidase T)